MPSADGVGESPDPLVSANLYGRPDEVLAQVVLPFWRELAASEADDCFLWALRYACGGEHLKLRVHAPARRGNEIGERLTAVLHDARLAAVGELAAASTAPPMDPEDALADRDPASPWLWTSYRRSPLVFGVDPLLADDAHAARLTACLGRAWSFVLGRWEAEGPARLPHQRRVTLLLRLAASGLQAAFGAPDRRTSYLAYHRDRIVRHYALRSGRGGEQADLLLRIFDRKLSSGGAVSQEILGRLTGTLSISTEPLLTAWQEAVSRLASYWRSTDADRPVTDPFAPDAIFPVLFRLFHALANGLGLRSLDEGLAYHLLVVAVFDPPPGAPAMFPPELEARLPVAERDYTASALSFDFEHQYLWTRYVAVSGPDGSRWAEDYRIAGRQMGPQIDQALGLLRRGQLGPGRDLLARIDACRRVLLRDSPSIGHVLSRFYYGALSYLYYADGDYPGAVSALEQAADSLRAAIGISSFLLPLAPILSDIPLKRAALARRALQWDEMQEHLIELLEMGLDQRPLCVLHDGSAIHYRDLHAFLSPLPLSEEERDALRNLADDRLRLVVTRRSIEHLYAPSDVLIPYP
jgi:hypothetical protein